MIGKSVIGPVVDRDHHDLTVLILILDESKIEIEIFMYSSKEYSDSYSYSDYSDYSDYSYSSRSVSPKNKEFDLFESDNFIEQRKMRKRKKSLS